MLTHSPFSKLAAGLLFIVIISSVVIIASFAFLNSPKASAVSATDFKAGRIIDDAVFYNKNTMNVSQIQAFLDRLIPYCDTWGTGQSPNYNGTRAQYAASQGWPGPPYVCLNKYHENLTTGETSFEKGGGAFTGGTSAAQIIYNAAQQYGINPQVLLVLLKKESAGPLTSDVWPFKSQYKYAMGYACPDSGPSYSANCDSSKAGLYKQVDLAAWQLKYYKDHPNDYRYKIGWNDIQYSPDPACGTKRVYIENISTLSLYIYTPYTPNQAALANYPGTAYCGAYGNRNFFMFFSEWFGSPSTPPATKCDSKVQDVICVWSVRKGDSSQFLTTSEAELSSAMYTYGWINEGIVFYASGTAKPGTTPVYRLRKDDLHHYTADQQEYTAIKNASGWIDEGVRFHELPPTASSNVSHRTYRLSNSATGKYYWVKDGQQKNILLNSGYTQDHTAFNSFSGIIATPQVSSGRNNIYSLKNHNTYLYSTDLMEAESAVIQYGYQSTGTLTTSNATNSGTPIYRLQGQGGGDYLFTSEPAERDSAISKYGYKDQGIRFYLDASSDSIYRFLGSKTSTHRYASVREAMALANKGWGYEKMLIQPAGLAPVYRLVSESNGEHFYTIDAKEATSMSNVGWKYELIAFNASPTTGAPVYRLYNGSDHFYTTDVQERDSAISKYGYKDQGIRFYVSTTSTAKPVYRLQGNGEHFYTASSAERDSAVQHYGYRYQGERFYLAP